MNLTLHTLLLAPMLALAEAADSQPPPPPAEAPPQSAAAALFWGGLREINMLFTRIGSLGGGATRGAVWQLDLASGSKQRIGTTDTLSWPVAATRNGPVFALRGNQLVRLAEDGTETAIGGDGAWRKLVGALPDGRILGFITAEPRPRAALITSDHVIHTLPAAETGEERAREASALQEDRDYANGKQLLVGRSEHGGQGFDIFLAEGNTQRNMTDCGNDDCGQPSLTSDGLALLYIRAEP
jgi:hypothetical protein